MVQLSPINQYVPSTFQFDHILLEMILLQRNVIFVNDQVDLDAASSYQIGKFNTIVDANNDALQYTIIGPHTI